MSGLNFYTADVPYVAFEMRGRFGPDRIFRVRAGQQQCYTYVPAANPRTARQQAWRWIFAQAVLGWQTLTRDFKLIYDRHASIHGGMTGFNWYVSEYLTRFASDS